MSDEMTGPQGVRALFARSVQVLALCLVTATGAAAQSTKAQPHCVPVGGSGMTNFIAADTTLGTATGDLSGGIGVTLVGVGPGPEGTTVFTVQHHWVTESGDTIFTGEAEATAVQVAPGLFAIVSYPVEITGGTGRFAGATGKTDVIGELDANTGRTVFRYHGEVCFKAPAR